MFVEKKREISHFFAHNSDLHKNKLTSLPDFGDLAIEEMFVVNNTTTNFFLK